MQHNRQTGFTLVELMVAVLLGMLTVIVIAQVLATSEAQRRQVASGGDAEINGSLSLFTLQRDIQMAGYGLAANPSALGCTVKNNYDSGTTQQFTLAPVIIDNGASDAPDTITVLQGHTSGSAVPMKIKEDKGTRFIVESTMGANTGDQVVAVPEAWSSTKWCTLYGITHNSGSADTSLTADNIPHADSDKWNAASIAPAGGYDSTSYLVNLGAPTLKSYAIDSNNLEVTERDAVDGSADSRNLYPEIVNLQALYGKDTSGDGAVDKYDHVTPTTAAEWKQVITVRLAVVARNAQAEKNEVTPNQPLWDVGSSVTVDGETLVDCGTSKCMTLKVSHLTDWKYYRYRVYTTTVPLRNVLWNS